jgi:hypothetical protein
MIGLGPCHPQLIVVQQKTVQENTMIISALIIVSLIAVLGILPGWPKATELKRNPMMSGVGLIVVITLILVAVLGV